jgi:hypothetical protein
MSGGYFNCKEHNLLDIASAIDDAIEGKKETGWFDDDTPEQYKKCVSHFKEASSYIRKAYEMTRCIDLLLKGDLSVVPFLERWDEKVNVE